MYEMSLMASFVFCVFYYIKKELTWFLRKTTQMLTSQPRDSVGSGMGLGTYILGGEGEAALVVSDATTMEVPWFGCTRRQVVPREHRRNTEQLCSHAHDGPQHVCF